MSVKTTLRALEQRKRKGPGDFIAIVSTTGLTESERAKAVEQKRREAEARGYHGPILEIDV